MSILLSSQSRVLVQGLTGREGTFHAEQMKAYGTNLVAGVSPGKGGSTHLGVPIFDTVADAKRDPVLLGANVVIVDPRVPGAEKFVRWVSETTGARVLVCASRCDESEVRAATKWPTGSSTPRGI